MRRALIPLMVTTLLLPAPSVAHHTANRNPATHPATHPAQTLDRAQTLEDLLRAIHARASDPLRGPTLSFLAGELPDGCDPFLCPSIRPVPAGDLDGDGSDDVFTSERHLDGWVLRARRGLDGTELWQTPIELEPFDFGYATLGRLAPLDDGASPIVLAEVRAPFTGLAEGVVHAFTATLDQRVRVLHPADGATLWEHRTEGSIIAGGVPAAGTYVWDIRGLLVDQWTVPDATGDGAPDVLVQYADRAGAAVALGLGPTTATSRLETLSGPTGERARGFAFPSGASVPVVVPVPDLSGDGLSDVVVVHGTTMALRADGAIVWERPASALGRWFVPTPARLGASAPGGWDLLVHATQVEAPLGAMVTALRGSTGATLWTRSAQTRSDVFALAGDLEGDGGEDVVQVGLDDDFHPRAHLIRTVDGASGVLIDTIEHAQPVAPGREWLGVPCFGCVADLTGDGRAEVLVRAIEIKDDGKQRTRTADLHAAIDLTSGEPRWTRRDPSAWLSPAAIDGDADGARDVAGRLGEPVVLVDGPTGAVLGTMPMAPEAEVEFGASIDGVPGDEAVAWLWFWDAETDLYDFGVEVSSFGGSLWTVLPRATAARPGG